MEPIDNCQENMRRYQMRLTIAEAIALFCIAAPRVKAIFIQTSA
jgi:hypothetical protein